MNGFSDRLNDWLRRHERRLIAGFCLVGALRVFIFTAAFPFFNNVDEHCHFDTIYKYARGDLPRAGGEFYDRGSAEYMVRFWSPAFTDGPESFANRVVPPALWRYPVSPEAVAHLHAAVAKRAARINVESTSPPVYYVVGAAWFKAGQWLGIRNLDLLYWIRFLNIPIFAALVYLCFAFGRRFFPENLNLRLGASLLLAFFPQDVFYSITPDTLSPLLVGWVVYRLLGRGAREGLRSYAFTGLLIALAVMNKFSNLVVIPLAALVLAGQWVRLPDSRRGMVRGLGPLVLGAAIPLGIWMAWNLYALGNPLGSGNMSHTLGFAWKPLSEWLNNALFTLKGAFYYYCELTRLFWRGEISWHGQRMESALADGFYNVSTGLAILVALKQAFQARSDSPARFVQRVCLLTVFLYVAFLFALSVPISYGVHRMPIHCGRLMLGALIPFLVLYLNAIEATLRKLRLHIPPLAVVGVIVLGVTASELALTWPVFADGDNWYHLFVTVPVGGGL